MTRGLAALLLALAVTGCGDNLAPPSPDGRDTPDPVVTCQAGYHLVYWGTYVLCEPDPDYRDAGVDGAP
jgi:hypothetical protein